MITHLLLASVLVYLTTGQGNPEQVCLVVPPSVNECFRSFNGKPIQAVSAQVSCLQELLWNFTPNTTLTFKDLSILDGLSDSITSTSGARNRGRGEGRGGRRGGRRGERRGGNGYPLFPPTGRRIRSEYRTLTAEQRRRFHDALNVLYRNGTIATFARIHANAVNLHHNGASFLVWHRVFLVKFEELLREVDPTVSLPYLDTSMDNDMDNAVNSVLWSDEYLGNGAGPVTSGPAAGWVTDQGNLERDYGRFARLFRKSDLRNVLSQCRLENISFPTANIENDFEGMHGGPHVWIGGDMSSGLTAAWDPAFYLHHAFVDYIFEVFRRRQVRVCGVDPTRDYPPVPNNSSHDFNAPMYAFPQYTNGDGLANFWIENFYDYDPAPRCPRCCEGCRRPAPIYCDRRRRVCVASSRRRGIAASAAFMSRTRNMTALNSEMLEASEVKALMDPVPPRNRGRVFRHFGNDERTLETAIVDAINAERAANVPEPPFAPMDRLSGSRRGSRRWS